MKAFQAFLALVILLLMNACELEKNISLERFFPQGQEAPVVYAFLGRDRLPQLELLHSLPLFPDSISRIPIPDALVFLFEDENLIDTLLFDGRFYYSSGRDDFSMDKFYHYEVRVPEFGLIRTEPLRFPNPPQVTDVMIVYSDEYQLGLDLIFQDYPVTREYYCFLVQHYKEGVLLSSKKNAAKEDELPFETLQIMDDQSFNGELFNQSFELKKYLLLSGSIPRDTLWADEIRIKYCTISESIHKYDKSLELSSGEIGGFLSSEEQVYSNITGAYGLFGTYILDSLVFSF